MKTGRLPHRPEQFARSLMASSAPSSPLYDYTLPRAPARFRMWNNDRVGCCTVAGLANDAIGLEAIHGSEPVIADDSVLKLFGILNGTPGATEDQLASSPGLIVHDVMDYVSSHGIDIGGQAPLVGKPSPLHSNRESIAGAMCNQRQGLGYLGIRIYQRDMDTFGQGPWVAKVADSGDLDSGHLLLSYAYAGLSDDQMVTLVTWGAEQPASWAWLMERLDEPWALEWPQLTAAP